MPSYIRDFLELPKGEVSDMSAEDLALEVEGWRAVVGTLPLNIQQWMARMHETCRFTLRNNTGHVGVLVGIEFAAQEYTVYERGMVFDTISGSMVIEEKEVHIPANGVSFFEFIDDKQPYSREEEDAKIAEQSLEGDNLSNG